MSIQLGVQGAGREINQERVFVLAQQISAAALVKRVVIDPVLLYESKVRQGGRDGRTLLISASSATKGRGFKETDAITERTILFVFNFVCVWGGGGGKAVFSLH